MDDDFANDGPSTRANAHGARRRSTRSSTLNSGNGSRATDDWAEWRGERRSARLGAPMDQVLDGPPPKRARTTDSAGSSGDAPPPVPAPSAKPIKVKTNGAAALKPTETVVEAVAGKKKSKFWVYAVEPIASAQHVVPEVQTADVDMEDNVGTSSFNGYRGQRGTSSVTDDGDRASSAEVRTNGDTYQKSLEGSLSPTSSMDES